MVGAGLAAASAGVATVDVLTADMSTALRPLFARERWWKLEARRAVSTERRLTSICVSEKGGAIQVDESMMTAAAHKEVGRAPSNCQEKT